MDGQALIRTPDAPPRHLAAVRLTAADVWGLLNGTRRVTTPLPDSARPYIFANGYALTEYQDANGRTVGVLLGLEHESFDLVAEGGIVPLLELCFQPQARQERT